MGRLFTCILAFWLAGTTAFAQSKETIEGVIGDQLQAFNDRDIDMAWQYASPMIQRLFGNPENFGTMVQRGYPMVWDNSRVEFLDQEQIGDAQRQKVLLRDQNGNLHVLLYDMIQTERGWEINGVQLVPAPDVGA
ncbi:DUF4864 domain-containing protein [Yoonia sediminilitoris]|uniref:Uncharacterized protein DUF4864 n=1 Tax=Yoonia sediminilitoris TaxID=1286148 RepID=A0A2T6KPV2_9RHOB|nr:DUF4864 domain-containing protein [Yoonia sediminilitoris]PUB18591.1 uncharacterized protein DUF4864 [Yoonia sediminilitoris]RCW98759.1 uncharacterized protein DUF4864 [Yoonia sediminilitoris]